MQATVLAVSLMTGFLLIVGLGIVLFVVIGFGARHLEDVLFARRHGWKIAGEIYAVDKELPDQAWVRHNSLHMTRARNTALDPYSWGKYFRCETQVTEHGFALRYLGKFRPRSLPIDHPVLFFAWSDLQVGIRTDLKGDAIRGTVTVVELTKLPEVALAFLDHDADRIAAASGGRWRITPAPPKPRP